VVIGISEDSVSSAYDEGSVFLDNPVTPVPYVTLLARGSQYEKNSTFMRCFIRLLGGPVALHNEFVRTDPLCLENIAS
jgi:hypothetical protein